MICTSNCWNASWLLAWWERHDGGGSWIWIPTSAIRKKKKKPQGLVYTYGSSVSDSSGLLGAAAEQVWWRGWWSCCRCLAGDQEGTSVSHCFTPCFIWSLNLPPQHDPVQQPTDCALSRWTCGQLGVLCGAGSWRVEGPRLPKRHHPPLWGRRGRRREGWGLVRAHWAHSTWITCCFCLTLPHGRLFSDWNLSLQEIVSKKRHN